MIVAYKSHIIFAFADTLGLFLRSAVTVEVDIFICAGDACEGFNPDMVSILMASK